MRTLQPLDSLSFFCKNGTCEASRCRCSLTYEPKTPESFWDWSREDIYWALFAITALIFFAWMGTR